MGIWTSSGALSCSSWVPAHVTAAVQALICMCTATLPEQPRLSWHHALQMRCEAQALMLKHICKTGFVWCLSLHDGVQRRNVICMGSSNVAFDECVLVSSISQTRQDTEAACIAKDCIGCLSRTGNMPMRPRHTAKRLGPSEVRAQHGASCLACTAAVNQNHQAIPCGVEGGAARCPGQRQTHCGRPGHLDPGCSSVL